MTMDRGCMLLKVIMCTKINDTQHVEIKWLFWLAIVSIIIIFFFFRILFVFLHDEPRLEGRHNRDNVN